ncbi:extracellular solute-binding protein [Paenibacillus sp. sptzw28]|uniref:sugar ABC transporter substrate-binding protein n=1 Tax=Paenibacillus sp. sptzw28 TaxID=715179 RepID=UPI001C6EC500|nr:extracellular solute-binding protein [Paenibacillus sp. sptzw28]QYR20104.1 extracellular solute-binding protein [Paenibacillus sp. sptzw28]
MSRRKYVLMLIGVFLICSALLVPMIGKPGSSATTWGGVASVKKPPLIDPNNEAAATIRIAVSMSEAEYHYWLESNEMFEMKHPAVKVVIVNFPENAAYEAWKTAAQSGEPFDVMLLYNNRVGEFAVQGYLLPADEIYTGDMLSDQLEALTNTLKWNGSLWGVPVDSNPMLIVWQSELLKRSGLNKPPDTWEDYIRGYNALQSALPSVMPINILLSDPRQITAWLGAFSGRGEAAKLPPLNAKAKQQIRFLAEHRGKLAEPNSQEQTAEVLSRLRAGELMSAVMPWTVYRSNVDDSVTIATPSKLPLAWLGGRSFVLSAQSERLEQARLWISQMTSVDGQVRRYQTIGTLPARKSAYAGEFETAAITSRPPYWALGLFKGQALAADPYWTASWDRWAKLWGSVKADAFTSETAEELIGQWNEESGAKAPLQVDGKLDN